MRISVIFILACLFFGYSQGNASELPNSRYGLWAVRGSCKTAKRFVYYSKDFYLFINEKGATLRAAISSRITNKFLIRQTVGEWQEPNIRNKPKYYAVSYQNVEKNILTMHLKYFSDEQNIEDFPDKPPEEGWETEQRTRCSELPPGMSFTHAEGITFMLGINHILDKCAQDRGNCIKHLFSLIDISKDNELSKAELCRLFRIFTYLAVTSKGRLATNKDITGAMGIASLLIPTVAGSVISGSDYDNDGQLSLDEIFYDRNMANVEAALEKISFDIATTAFTKMFQGLGGVLEFIK